MFTVYDIIMGVSVYRKNNNVQLGSGPVDELYNSTMAAHYMIMDFIHCTVGNEIETMIQSDNVDSYNAQSVF